MVEAVAAREPPNSARSGGKKTGKALVIPVTRSAEAKARRSRPLTRLSRRSLITGLWLDSRRWLPTPASETDLRRSPCPLGRWRGPRRPETSGLGCPRGGPSARQDHLRLDGDRQEAAARLGDPRLPHHG